MEGRTERRKQSMVKASNWRNITNRYLSAVLRSIVAYRYKGSSIPRYSVSSYGGYEKWKSLTHQANHLEKEICLLHSFSQHTVMIYPINHSFHSQANIINKEKKEAQFWCVMTCYDRHRLIWICYLLQFSFLSPSLLVYFLSCSFSLSLFLFPHNG